MAKRSKGNHTSDDVMLSDNENEHSEDDGTSRHETTQHERGWNAENTLVDILTAGPLRNMRWSSNERLARTSRNLRNVIEMYRTRNLAESAVAVFLKEPSNYLDFRHPENHADVAAMFNMTSPELRKSLHEAILRHVEEHPGAMIVFRDWVLKSIKNRNDQKFNVLMQHMTSVHYRVSLFEFCIEKLGVIHWTVHVFQVVVNALLTRADLMSKLFLQVNSLHASESEEFTDESRQKIDIYLQALQLQHENWWQRYPFETKNPLMPSAPFLLYITLISSAQSILFLQQLEQYLTPEDFEVSIAPVTWKIKVEETPLLFALKRFGIGRVPVIAWLVKMSDINNPEHEYPVFLLIKKSLSFTRLQPNDVDDLLAELSTKPYNCRLTMDVDGTMMNAREYCEHEMLGLSEIPDLFSGIYHWLMDLEVNAHTNV